MIKCLSQEKKISITEYEKMIRMKTGHMIGLCSHLGALCSGANLDTQNKMKEYGLEIGIEEKVWDEGVNKAVDKYFGSKYNEELTENCHTFLERTIPNGKEKVKKVAQATKIKHRRLPKKISLKLLQHGQVFL